MAETTICPRINVPRYSVPCTVVSWYQSPQLFRKAGKIASRASLSSKISCNEIKVETNGTSFKTEGIAIGNRGILVEFKEGLFEIKSILVEINGVLVDMKGNLCEAKAILVRINGIFLKAQRGQTCRRRENFSK